MSEKKFEVLVQIRAALTQQDIDDIMVSALEGGINYPKDERVTKVTREQFASLKRDGATKIDPNGQVEEDPADDDDDDGGLV